MNQHLDQIDNDIAEKHLLKHPFYLAWTRGELSKEALADYARQYYHHVAAFPTYLSAVHAKCDDQGTRKQLLANLIDEEAGSPNHPELWMKFAEGLGLEAVDVGGVGVSLAGADFGKPVFCIPGLGRLDDCAVLIVADSLRREGINARVAGTQTAIENDEVSSICICYVENVSKARLDYTVRKASKKSPAARVVVCLLSDKGPSEGGSGSQQETHSLKATIAALAHPAEHPGASQAALNVQS